MRIDFVSFYYYLCERNKIRAVNSKENCTWRSWMVDVRVITRTVLLHRCYRFLVTVFGVAISTLETRFMSDACSAFRLRNDNLTSGYGKEEEGEKEKRKGRKYFSSFPLFLSVYEEKARGGRGFNEDCASRRTMLADALLFQNELLHLVPRYMEIHTWHAISITSIIV